MPQIRSYRQVAVELRKIRPRIIKAAIAVVNTTANDALRRAVRASSGKNTPATLRRAKHPYGYRNPQPGRFPPGIVNVGKGDFRKGWRVVPAVVQGNKVVARVENTDPKAKFMSGTDKMVPRTIRKTVVTPEFMARFRARLDREMKKALKIK